MLLAERLADEGWILRTGHAPGMDQAFEMGAGRRAEVFLPWPSFEHSEPLEADTIIDRPSKAAQEMAQAYHPAGAKLGALLLHARNCHQVLGRDLDEPVKFLVCWTPGAREEGGTAQAMRMARSYRVPVFNLALPEHRERIETFALQSV